MKSILPSMNLNDDSQASGGNNVSITSGVNSVHVISQGSVDENNDHIENDQN